VNLKDHDESWNERRKRRISKFWLRLGGKPPLEGMTILDLGCGGGYLSLDMASNGASKVIGIDIDADSISYARRKLKAFAELSDKVAFLCMDLKEYDPREKFDLMVSQDAFEHILNLETLLPEIIKRLKPGGRLYVGFGPLWNSPYGGHRRMKMPIPWGHVIFPEKMLLKWVNLFYDKKFHSIMEMGLNKLSVRDYKKLLLENPALRVKYWKINHEDRLISRIFAKLAQVPFLEELFSHDIYAVLEKVKGF